jgi:hypothetical protein
MHNKQQQVTISAPAWLCRWLSENQSDLPRRLTKRLGLMSPDAALSAARKGFALTHENRYIAECWGVLDSQGRPEEPLPLAKGRFGRLSYEAIALRLAPIPQHDDLWCDLFVSHVLHTTELDTIGAMKEFRRAKHSLRRKGYKV